MTYVTFVTGVSCAGKTTLGTAVSELWSDMSVIVRGLDEDAPASPSTAWLDWLRWRAAEELNLATRLATGDEGAMGEVIRAPGGWCAGPSPDYAFPKLNPLEHIVVTGIVWPLRLIESPAWAPARKAGLTVRFLMLDPPWKVLRERLDVRAADKPKAERKALRDYNRELAKVLREQVLAVNHGQVLRKVVHPDVATATLMDGDW